MAFETAYNIDQLNIMPLLGVAHLTWKRYLQRGLLGQGITVNQLYVMGRLAKCEHLLPSEIAELLFCDRPTATVVIRNLVKNGWVEKERSPMNGKQILVSITVDGRAKLEAVKKTVVVDVDPLACLNDSEQKEMRRLLQKLNKHLQSNT